MPFTDYADTIDGGLFYEGQLAKAEPGLIRSGINADTVVLAFGLGLAKGTGDDDLIIPAATGFKFMGVSFATDTFEKREGYSIDANGKMGYPLDYRTSYVRRGIVAVPIDSDCAKGSPVYCIHTASSGQVPGHFRKDANTDKADLVPNAVFWKTLSAAGIGLIALNLP